MGHNDPDAENTSNHSEINWKTVAVATATSLLVAMLGAGVDIFVTDLGNDKDRELQVAQFKEQQREGARLKREEVYREFLDASNDFAEAADDIHRSCRQARESTSSALVGCDSGRIAPQAHRYRSAINDVYIYGTSESVAALNGVVDALPDAPVGADFVAQPVDRNRFHRAYTSFMTVMCLDVRVDPDQPCR